MGWGWPHPDLGRRALYGLQSVVGVRALFTLTPVAAQRHMASSAPKREKGCERIKKRCVHFGPNMDASTEASVAIYSNL